MIVVSDTSPISYLVLIGEIQLLPALFEAVLVPTAVARELRHPGGPAPIRSWMKGAPAWLQVAELGSRELPLPTQLAALDDGEQEAILLAQRRQTPLVVLDDKAAREVAFAMGLRVTGTLGLLQMGARRGLLALPTAIARLRKTSFRVVPELLERLLEENG